MMRVRAITNIGIRNLDLSIGTIEMLNNQFQTHPNGVPYVDEDGQRVIILGITLITKALDGKCIKVGVLDEV